MDVGGGRVRAKLDSNLARAHRRRVCRKVELRSVDYDGLEVEELSVRADDVGLATAPNVALIMSGVELQGRSALESSSRGWTGSSADGRSLPWTATLIEAARRSGGRRYVVHAAVRNGIAEVELRALRLRRITVPLPQWLRLTRKLALPPLPGGASVIEVRHLETGVEFRLSLPGIRQAFDPGRVRRAILASRSASA